MATARKAQDVLVTQNCTSARHHSMCLIHLSSDLSSRLCILAVCLDAPVLGRYRIFIVPEFLSDGDILEGLPVHALPS
jgi:hypothetical protein